jgi:nitroreductase
MGTYSDALKRRTIRVFQQKNVPFSLLKKCVNAARLSPSARNTQPLRFVAVNEVNQVAAINEAVYFGGAVKEKGRVEGQEPKAFIVILVDKEKKSEYTDMDIGIAAEAIALTAFEQGVGSCIQGAIQRERIKGILGIPNEFEIPLVIALGFPAEKPVLEGPTKDLFYWIDIKGELHVPKLALEEVLHKNRFGEG